MSISCSSSRQLEGIYCNVQKMGPDFATIDFSNKTFLAKTWSDVAGEFITKGSWSKIGDTVFLNPVKNSVVDSIVEISSPVGENLVITFIDKQIKKPLKNIKIRVKRQEYVSNEDGVIEMPQINSNILYLTYNTISDTLKTSLLMGKVDIYLDFRKLKSFKLPEKWLLKGNKLSPLQKNFTSFKKCK